MNQFDNHQLPGQGPVTADSGWGNLEGFAGQNGSEKDGETNGAYKIVVWGAQKSDEIMIWKRWSEIIMW